MKKVSLITLLFFISFIVPITIGAQITQAIKGTVLDKEAEYPLIGVNVILLNNEDVMGTTTDIDGNFQLENVPIGRQTIQFSYIGYKPVTRTNLLISSGKEMIINVEMEEDLSELSEVVVTATKGKRKAVNEMAAVSARSMSMEEVSRFSGSLGDVSRMAQNYAGVSGASDDRNDIIVRGNSPSAVLWRMEGVDIPSPNHWASLGTTGGPISMLNSNLLRTSDFLSSAFPAEYGNATGAVFDLKMRNGNPDKYEFLGQIGFNGFELGAEGPMAVGKKSSFLANYRYSTLGVFQALGLDFGTGNNVPQYQDGAFKINIPTEKAGRFSLWGLGGTSKIVFEPEPEGNLFSDGDSRFEAGSTTFMGGVNHTYFFNNTTSSTLALSYSTTSALNFNEEIIDLEKGIFAKDYVQRNFQGKLGVNWTLNKKIDAKNRVKGGLIYDLYNIDVQDSVLIDNSFWFDEIEFEGNAGLYRAFAQWQYKANDKLTVNSGLHTVYYDLNDSYSIEPRINASYEVTPRSTFGLGYGRHSQLQPLPIYFTKRSGASAEDNAANEQLDMIKSNHFVASWDFQPTSKSRIKLEGYFQMLSDVAVDPDRVGFSMINFGADFGFPNRVGLTNEGTGSNTGVELTLERFLDKGFYFLGTASIFDSKYEDAMGNEYNTFFNSNYVFNVLAGKEFNLTKTFALTLDAKFNYAGGRRYTPFDVDASILEGEGVRDENNIYGERYSPYIRPDIKIGIRHNAKNYSQIFFVDLQNFIGRDNVFFDEWDDEKQEIDFQYQRGFFPDVRYQILF